MLVYQRVNKHLFVEEMSRWWLVSSIFYVHPDFLGKYMQFDLKTCFSDGLKPPTKRIRDGY